MRWPHEPANMSWPRALAALLFIIMAESVNGTLRQVFVAPVVGDLHARQLGLLVAMGLIFVIACMCIRWIGARLRSDQLKVGAVWVVLMLGFEFSIGIALGYDIDRLTADYNPLKGGYMLLGMAFLFFAPALAAAARRYR